MLLSTGRCLTPSASRGCWACSMALLYMCIRQKGLLRCCPSAHAALPPRLQTCQAASVPLQQEQQQHVVAHSLQSFVGGDDLGPFGQPAEASQHPSTGWQQLTMTPAATASTAMPQQQASKQRAAFSMQLSASFQAQQGVPGVVLLPSS